MIPWFPNVRADIRHFLALARRPEDREPPSWVLHPVAGPKHLLRTLGLILAHQSLQALLLYRMGRWILTSWNSPLRWLPALALAPVYGLLLAFVRAAYDIYLETSADIGPGLYIGHLGGIRVSRCRLGSYCSIHQRVRIGPARPGEPGPTIGDRVWVGAHAEIVGDVRVGDGATIGAGAVVTGEIPAGALVLGRPARVIALNYDNSCLL